MTERIPWWRAFLPKRKSGGSKDAGSKDTVQERPKEPTPAASKTTADQSTCRRNMRVSRSGRFKERRRQRQSLPIQENDTENLKREDKEVM
uniref:Uncharacterized protein n=1 Tax=Sphaeramia orbicularis TaxID=375764 RepID=A0A673BB51_9TELE